MNKTSILLWDEMDVPGKDDRLCLSVQHPDVETLSLDVLEGNAPIDAVPGPFALVPGLGLEIASDE